MFSHEYLVVSGSLPALTWQESQLLKVIWYQNQQRNSEFVVSYPNMVNLNLEVVELI